MFIARIDTSNFNFMAAGSTEEQALNALRSGWNAHAAATGATIPADEIVGDAHVDEITPGMCIVDGDLVIYSEPHPAAADPYVHDGSIFSAEHPCKGCDIPVREDEYLGYDEDDDGNTEYFCENCFHLKYNDIPTDNTMECPTYRPEAGQS